MKKIFILSIKLIPIIQMVGMLLNNLLYYFDIGGRYIYLIDVSIGNSLVTTLLLFICSYTFGFCKWHRLIITSNLCNAIIATIDAIYRLPISDLQLLITYPIISSIFILLAIYNKFVYKNEKCHKTIS